MVVVYVIFQVSWPLLWWLGTRLPRAAPALANVPEIALETVLEIALQRGGLRRRRRRLPAGRGTVTPGCLARSMRCVVVLV